MYVRNGSLPFSTLEVTDGVRKYKTVAPTDRLNNAACKIVLAAA
jgi:hypothetical protein